MKSVQTLFLVLGLSLATWFIFYELRLPLDRLGTAIVTGVWLVIVLSTKWLWTHVLSPRAKEKHNERT
jgi:hypothetical protein